MKKFEKERKKEVYQPFFHVAPDTFVNRILFFLRLFFDLQVATQYKDIKKFLVNFRNNVLEVGCGLQPYKHLVPKEANYYALDWKDAEEDFSYNLKRTVIRYGGDIFPFKQNSFDFVFHTEVLEHIYDLRQFLLEAHRVLVKNGIMLFTVPFAARYHYIPYDYWRVTPSALKKLLENSHFDNIVITARGSDITVAVYKLNTVFLRIMLRRGIKSPFVKILNLIFFGTIFIMPVIFLTIIGHLSILLKIGSPDDCLGWTVHCRAV